MKNDNVPLATILCIIGIIACSLLGDAIILAIAPSPTRAGDSTWWGLIGLGLVHHLGGSVTSSYLSAFHLASYQEITTWAHQNPGYWGWIEVARWWWLIATVISICITFRWVWRTPDSPDQHRRGTRLSQDLRTYKELINELRMQVDTVAGPGTHPAPAQGLTERDIVVVDEAGMLGSRQTDFLRP